MDKSELSIPLDPKLRALTEPSSPNSTDLFSRDGLAPDETTLKKAIADVDPEKLRDCMDKDGTFLIDLSVRQSYTDQRKTILFQILIARRGSIPPLDQHGGYIQRETFCYGVDPQSFIGLNVLVEAQTLCWCPLDASLVRSASSSWPEMLTDTGTHRTMSITATQLANGEVVSCELCGTPDGQNTALDGEIIPGALTLIDVFEDSEADGGRESFELIAQPSYPDGDPYIIAYPSREIVVET